MLTTPILFLVFNRPDTTQKVFEKIKEAKPKYLFIAADGPRENNENDTVNCKKVREIVSEINWDCEVKTLFREKNLGCKIAVSSAITWFFENVEQGIILEDDTLPDISFFYFCQDMLNKYKDDYQLMHVNGSNFHPKREEVSNRYFFSHLFNIWGWATWRRAWKLYDIEMNGYEWLKRSNEFDKIFPENYKKFIPMLDSVYNNLNNTWDCQWALTCHLNIALSIQPMTNLIKNIGFGTDSTHTNVVNNNRIIEHGRFKLPTEENKKRNVKVEYDNFIVSISH